MSSLELRTLYQFNSGLGVSETPEVLALPWDRPDPKEVAKEARMSKLQNFGVILSIVGGSVGLFLSLKSLGLIGKKKR